jgi:hypothetical protein
LVWVERQNFQGWICNECAWVFKPSGTITGRSLDEMKGELRAAARPEVQISCLYRAPESHKKSRLAKSLAGQMRGSRVPQGSCPSKQERADEGEGEGRSGAALQDKMARFPVRTGTQRTRNSPATCGYARLDDYSEPPPKRRMTMPVEIQ